MISSDLWVITDAGREPGCINPDLTVIQDIYVSNKTIAKNTPLALEGKIINQGSTAPTTFSNMFQVYQYKDTDGNPKDGPDPASNDDDIVDIT